VWARRDEIDGVAVFRCRSYVAANRGILRKTLGHLSFMVTGWSGLSRAARESAPDVVIASSPTFFAVVTAWAWCARRRVPFVFEVRDLWPAVFVELGVLRNRFAIAVLEALEVFLYRRAALVVTVTRAFRDAITRRGIPEERVGVITNGVDEQRFRPAQGSVARRPSLAGRFVVLYLGAHGISHALTRILDAAELLRDLPDVLFAFVGDGAEKAALIESARVRGLTNVLFEDSVPKDDVLAWYHESDVALVPLRDVPIFHTFIPSKMFELLAAGIPIVASVAGEARALLTESGGAVVVDPEDAGAIASAIRLLHAEPSLRRQLVERGHPWVLANATRRSLGERYLEGLAYVVEQAR
jgi:glycosyltransferase involved in cell wall biosynthesis